MILTVPAETAVTSPVVALTVATAVLLELQATARPVSVLPFASSVVAVACDVPITVMEVGERATVTEATGTGVTVAVALPVLPSLVAMMLALPTATAVTTPVTDTVATA
jgi:hypothetical protein